MHTWSVWVNSKNISSVASGSVRLILLFNTKGHEGIVECPPHVPASWMMGLAPSSLIPLGARLALDSERSSGSHSQTTRPRKGDGHLWRPRVRMVRVCSPSSFRTGQVGSTQTIDFVDFVQTSMCCGMVELEELYTS